MKIPHVVLWLMLFLLLGNSLQMTAQQKPSPINITLEDPELYFAFLRSHSAVDQQIQSASAGRGPADQESALVAYWLNWWQSHPELH